MSDVDARLSRAWALRANRRLDECLAETSGLKTALHVPHGHLDCAQIAGALAASLPKEQLERVVSVLLLSASLARAQGDFTYGHSLARALEARCVSIGHPASARLQFEKGLFELIGGESHAALELFLAAAAGAATELERLSALINAILCLENLALPFAGTLAEAERLATRLREHEEITGALAQLEALYRRLAFREGRIGEAVGEASAVSRIVCAVAADASRIGCAVAADASRIGCAVAADASRIGCAVAADASPSQASFFVLALRQLPYHAYHRAPEPRALERLSVASPGLYDKSYRLRTLQGMMHPDDSRTVRISERVDRLYLWVWRWLAAPSEFPVERVVGVFGGVLEDAEPLAGAARLTAEDREMLSNALGWLALFDPPAGRRLQTWLRPHAGLPVSGSRVLEIERLTLHFLRALRDGRACEAGDFRASLEAHPLWCAEDLHFRALVEAVTGDGKSAPAALSVLVTSLRGLLPRRGAMGPGWRVDLDRLQIHGEGLERGLVSEPLCRALELLREHGSVSCETFIGSVFGLRYEPQVHRPKIFNLLSRLRALRIPGLSFRVRSGLVISDGHWDRISFERSGGREHRLRLVESAPISSISRPLARDVLARWPAKTWLTSEEVEALIGGSRSTAVRWLRRWVEDGVVVRKGKARATRYRRAAGRLSPPRRAGAQR